MSEENSSHRPPHQEAAPLADGKAPQTSAPPANTAAHPAKQGNSNNNSKKKDKKASVAVQEVEPPAWLEERLKIFEEEKAKATAAQKDRPDESIVVTLPDKSEKPAIAWKTTPYEIAKSISRGLADSVVVALVDGKLFDLHRPLEKSCSLSLCKFDSKEGNHCFWHSSAHILGQALERLYGASLTVGPALDDGFYYDVDIQGQNISADDYPKITQLAEQVIKEKQPFERLAVPRDVALKMFQYNKFKQEIISKIPQDETVTLYKSGSLIDLCRGPHLPNTGYVKAFRLTKISGVYWMAKAENPLLQRIYGIAFPDKKQLTEWEEFQKEAAKRDHRNIGQEQELFFVHPYSPGSAFFLPHGARIYNKLIQFIKEQYHVRGFTEVITPNMFNKKLWETSGHWQNYKDDMFTLPVDKEDFALKPMNCPSHCLMFDHRPRSYRELPMRFADFGVLHRNELAGALTGLTRVRRFQQDDAHIFCAFDMIEKEIQGCLEFMQHVYGVFGFDFNLKLSTRPENFLGEIAVWDKAEQALKTALDRFGKEWTLNPGDGAFYGPKIDIQVRDALKRPHQCATIQLDFQLPIRFNLEYTGQAANEKMRPVMIHRAILGSVERMIAVLIEHTGGKWPFWLSPRQAVVLSISDKHNEYVEKVAKQLSDAGYYVDSDVSDKTIPKKIREAQLAQYNYILVAGDEEVTKETVAVRTRDNVQHGTKSVAELLVEFGQLAKDHK